MIACELLAGLRHAALVLALLLLIMFTDTSQVRFDTEQDDDSFQSYANEEQKQRDHQRYDNEAQWERERASRGRDATRLVWNAGRESMRG